MSDFFAVAIPGLEPIVAAELHALGITGRVEEGGVAWSGAAASLYAAALHLRTASRLFARLGEFRARGFPELERHACRIDWTRILPPDTPVALRVTARKSRLYHERAIAERLLGVIREAVPGATLTPSPARPRSTPSADDDAAPGNAQLVVVRFLRDACSISADAAGALHMRGYRQAVAKAPLRETLAAALLLAVGYDGAEPLLDPFCGAGTIPIEAALIARRVPPGLATADRVPRVHPFQAWGGFDAAAWIRLLETARAGILPAAAAAIVGSDRDEGAVVAARSNAARAGVGGDLSLERRALSEAPVPAGVGLLLTNPPYGVRVGRTRELRDLYAALGNFVRQRLAGWRVAFLSADASLGAHTGLVLESVLTTRNGGIRVELVKGGPR